MLCGSSARFAVKWEVCRRSGDQILGRFALVIAEEEVGDYSDDTTYLAGCYNWIRGFIESPENRFEPGLFEMDKDLAYRNLVNPVYSEAHGLEPMPEVYEDTYGRFHLEHLGMTSMDDYVLLLVKSQTGESRFIWKKWGGEVREAYLGVNEVEDVFSEFLVKARPDLP